MTVSLVISRHFPSSDEMVHGAFQRLDSLVRAVTRVSKETRCLFLLPEAERMSEEDRQRHEQRLRQRWSPNVSLSIAATLREGNAQPTPWQLYGRGVFDFHSTALMQPYDNAATRDAITQALKAAPDLVLAHRLPVMATLARLPAALRRMPIVFDLDDIEHVAIARRLLRSPAWPMERLKLLQLPAVIRGERVAMSAASQVLVCSTGDRKHLERYLRARSVEVMPNSVTIPAASTEPTEPIVLFVGIFSYAPNAVAADHLVQNIWPLVRARAPEGARLLIVGKNPQHIRSSAHPGDGVTFTGFVDDLAALYRRARVVCCPLLSGGGTRLKIIEGAAHGKAMVSTSIGAEGLDFEPGKEILISDDVSEFASQCASLLAEPQRAQALGAAARERARQLYDREEIANNLAGALRKMVARADAPSASGTAAAHS